MKETFSKSGRRLVGRLYELYTGECPPERPCTPEMIAAYRVEFDKEVVDPPLDDIQGPSLFQKAVNFSRAIVRHVVAGMPTVTDEQADARVAVCESNKCGFYKEGACLHPKCGCELEVKVKWAGETCPLGLWPKT